MTAASPVGGPGASPDGGVARTARRDPRPAAGRRGSSIISQATDVMEPTAPGDEADATGRGVEVRVNGERRTVPPGLTLSGLLEELEVDGRRVAVEHNRRVVPRDERGDVEVEAGDEVEIVQFVGGGR